MSAGLRKALEAAASLMMLKADDAITYDAEMAFKDAARMVQLALQENPPPRKPKPKVVWYARDEDLLRLGPFSSQSEAWVAVLDYYGNPLMGACVWCVEAPAESEVK